MNEKISKISVDGVVYDIASTGGGEVPGDIQEQLSALENKVTEEASAREEGDAKLQAAIDELAEKVNGEGADLTELEGKIEKNAADIATVNNNLVEAVNNINKNVADGFSTINEGLNNEIRPELEKAVKYEDVADSNLPERKAIVLKNGDVILGGNLEGGTSSLVQLNRWGVADFGSSSVPFNINTPKDVRPTVQEAGQSGEEAHKIAYLSDVESSSAQIEEVKAALGNDPDFAGTVTTELAKKANSIDVYTKEEADAKFITEHQSLEGLATEKFVEEQIAAIPPIDLTPYVSDVAGLSNTLEALNATVQILQSKVDVLTKTNTEVVSVDGSAGELKDSSKDYIVSGSINENAEIVGKSISLKSIKVSDNARLKLNAGDVEAKDLNISGSFPKANGNTVISVNNAEFIVFKDMVFDASEVYNGIEIGLASNSVLPKNILFDNCKFQGEFSNNAILVFGTQDNAIITLNNCYFEKISNALRLSNKSNASGVVVNINNCTVDQWETRAPWQGFLICEDYTNKTEEEVNANNLFGDGKITVNFNNLVHAGVKINPADPASVCSTKNESQVVMVCQDAVAGPEGDYCLSYDAAKFPVVSFK
jgi:hypothetical protein